MKLGVLIINWNNAQDTIACAESVHEWRKLIPSIWIVDNGSYSDDASRITQSCPYARLIRNSENLGFSGGNNTALRHAVKEGYDYILLLNNDARLQEQSAILMVDALGRNPKIGIIGPVLRETRQNKVQFSFGGRNIGRYLNTRITTDGAPRQGKPQAIDYVPGTAVLLRVEAIHRVGYFDERYFFSGEMADLCRRAQLYGYHTTVLPGAFADHDTNRSNELRSTLYAYYNLRNRFLYVATFETLFWKPIWKLFWIGCGFAMATKCLLRNRRREARALWLGLIDGCTGRFGNQNERIGS